MPVIVSFTPTSILDQGGFSHGQVLRHQHIQQTLEVSGAGGGGSWEHVETVGLCVQSVLEVCRHQVAAMPQ